MALGDGRVLLYFRTFGHMGNWGYQISDDGGYTWMRPPVPLVDFDQNPRTPLDTWACTYHTARLSADRRWLHVGFSYMDESTLSQSGLCAAVEQPLPPLLRPPGGGHRRAVRAGRQPPPSSP